mmetsp:Transcript_8896/g.20960  ORF Transcript_8896/g.20960 Transcript_8896/m.20960 type:complete len:331 (+) Transcript_8896:65-1057(+)
MKHTPYAPTPTLRALGTSPALRRCCHPSGAPRQRRRVYEDVGQLVSEKDLGVVGHGAHGLELDELGRDARPVGLRLAGGLVELGIGLGLLPREVHVVLDGLDALHALLLCQLLAELDGGDGRPLLRLAHGALGLGLRLLLHEQLRLRRHLDLTCLLLRLLVIEPYLFGYPRLGDAYRNDLDPRSPAVDVRLQRVPQRLVERVELGDVHLLEGVCRAELVDLVVDLVIDPRLVVVDRVVLDRLVHVLALQSVDHLDLVEGDHGAARGAAWDLGHLVRLQSDLYRLVPREQRPHMMEARVRHAVEQGPAPPVDADVPFRHAVDAKQAFDACQ